MNNQTYLSIEEIVSIPSLSSASISEDGKRVAFVKKTANWKDNKYENHIWIYEKDKEQCSSLANGISPLWSPDCRHIAYLSQAGNGTNNKNQIIVQSIDGHQKIQLTDNEDGISFFKWDPYGKGIFYVSSAKESERIKKRRELYGDYHHIEKDYKNSCLFYIDIKSANRVVKQLTNGKDFHIHGFDVSHDGTKVVLMAAPTSKMSDYIHGNLYILDLQTSELQKLHIDKLLGGNVWFSPDGSKICYTASIREKHYYKNHIQDSTIKIYDLHSEEIILPIKDIDSTVTPIRWTEKGILITWQHKTNNVMGLLLENGTVEMISEEDFIMDPSITKDGNHISYLKATSNETFEVYFDDRKITNEKNYFNGKLKSNREIIKWYSRDGLEIEGILSTPVDFDPSKAYPLLVVIHGGPAWASFPIFSNCFNEKYPIEQFVENGFIVLEPNYRGSSGYGNDFLKANYRKLGIAEYDDILSGVDHLVKKGVVDKEKVGVMGWSYGGSLAAFCTTYSSRFKAISVGGGMTNWITYYVHTDIPYFTRTYLGNDPWNDPEIYSKSSAMTYIKSACTPTLIQHGELDTRVPVPNSYELYKGLKDRNVDTEFFLFKGMAYSSEQPKMTAAIMKQNVLWFSHYILGEKMEDLSVL